MIRLKNKMPSFLVISVIIIYPLLFPIAHAQLDDWTFMVYLAGDNDLESSATNDFLEMADIGSNSDINILVLFDRRPGYDTRYGDWTNTRRGIVNLNDIPDASWGVSMGERNMGDPENLWDFVEWGMQNYPAGNYAIILWDHGNGWSKSREDDPIFKTICWDDTDNDQLRTRELGAALDSIMIHEEMVDLVGFDACLMQMIEVAHEIYHFTHVTVGSEEVIPTAGWPYDTILDDLTDTPTMDAYSLGCVMVNRYYQSYGNDEVLSSLKMTGWVPNVTFKIDDLAEALISSWDISPGACIGAAYEVIEAVEGAVECEQHGSSWPGANGLAIYFPELLVDFDTDYNSTTIEFLVDARWDDFLDAFYTAMSGSWVANARAQSQEFYRPTHIDLLDFCSKLIDNGPDFTWVDFGYSGTENGNYETPYNTLPEAISATPAGGNICIKGGTTTVTVPLDKQMKYSSCLGTTTLNGP